MKTDQLRCKLDEALDNLLPYVESLKLHLSDFDDSDPESCDALAHFLEGLSSNAQKASEAAGELEAALGYSEANKSRIGSALAASLKAKRKT